MLGTRQNVGRCNMVRIKLHLLGLDETLMAISLLDLYGAKGGPKGPQINVGTELPAYLIMYVIPTLLVLRVGHKQSGI